MFQGWDTADYLQATQIIIGIIEILVTAFVAIWVVQSVQKKIDDEKVLKDFFSKEIIQLRTDLRTFLDNLIKGGITTNSVKQEHNILRVRINDLMSALNIKYNFDKKYLSAYQQNLLKIIEADLHYEEGFASNKKIKFTEDTIEKLHTLRVKNDHLFNDILIKLYESR